MNLVHDRLDNRTLRLAGAGCAILLLSCALKAEETCNVEAKLLLDPAQTQTAIQALRAKRETPSHVYFYDTDALDLLTQGVILRLRQGAETEFTVKMRHPQGKSFADPSEGPGRISFKCEVDFIGGQGKPSYSLKSGYPEGQIPPTGEKLRQALSPAQTRLLTEAGVSIDWKAVKRIADIQSTTWRIKSMPGFGEVALELWQFPGGQVLELSTRGSPDEGPTLTEALRNLADSKGLSVNPHQLPKTTAVLEQLAHTKVH